MSAPVFAEGQSEENTFPVPHVGFPIEALADTERVEEFDISPDGRLVAYKSAKAGTYDIWVAPIAGGEPTRLTDMPSREMRPQLSPSGQWIVFEADTGGVNLSDLYLVSVLGGDIVRLTNHPSWYHWRSDGVRQSLTIMGSSCLIKTKT